MNLHLHNTLTKTKELFVPINPDQVGIYSCGPTVYGAPHIGNMRKYFIDDLLKNTIKHIVGLNTKHVVNITDVGHLTSDEDSGEDKMEKGARKEGITAWDVAKKYEQRFLEDCEWLKIDGFDVMPRATDHIPQQIAMIQQLVDGGYTYEIQGDGLYMDTSKVKDYAVLIGQKHIEGLQSGVRVDDDGKRNATDFALWKFNITGKQRDMEWDSPWGVGFPGRHIECSAMSIAYLGNHIDIHTGGIDHIPVHHTNEIAQSQCSCADTPWVNYWLHYQFLNINGDKISKSHGTVIELCDVAERGYCAEDLRMFYLQAHYRSFQDFTWEGLDAAKQARLKLWKRLSSYNIHQKPDGELVDFLKQTLLDDLNTPQLIARMFASLDIMDDEIATAIKLLDDYVLKLGLFNEIAKVDIPTNIITLADQRRQAKLNKDYDKADEIRGQLSSLGWSMLDAKDDYELEKI